jgi:hypothetical protein
VIADPELEAERITGFVFVRAELGSPVQPDAPVQSGASEYAIVTLPGQTDGGIDRRLEAGH